MFDLRFFTTRENGKMIMKIIGVKVYIVVWLTAMRLLGLQLLVACLIIFST